MLWALSYIIPNFYNEVFCESGNGYTALKNMWDRYCSSLNFEPIVIDGELLRNHPKSILSQYCGLLSLDFQEEMLSWEDGKVREWKPSEQEAHARFHKTLESSKGFIPSDQFQYNDNVPFDEREAEMVDRALDIYHEIVPYAITPKWRK